jgi:serine/threonine-protein kinase
MALSRQDEQSIQDDLDKTRTLKPPDEVLVEMEDPDALNPGTVAGAYVLQRMVASGGGGTVYEAQHRLLGRRTAVKVLRRELASSPQMVKRFLREALAVNVIKHPHIVDIYEFGELPDGRPFYVMELLEGVDLRTMLTEKGRFSPPEVVELLEPVCSALEAAHAQGIVHRDLKASNILICQRDGRPFPKLLDFGIAKLLHPENGDAGLTVVGTRLGTSYTMAPEQIRASTVDARTDIYALGVVLFHLLTGQYPFRGEKMSDIERQHLETPPPRASQHAPVSTVLDAVILKAMEKAPDRRFPTVKAFFEALQQAVGVGRMDAQSAVESDALGLYVEVRVRDESAAESDEVLDDVSAVLDTVEQHLRLDGWIIALQTGNAILGVKPLVAGDAEAREQGIQFGETLLAELAERPTAQPAVHLNLALHCDRVLVRFPGEENAEVLGGDLVSTSRWVPDVEVEGLYVSARARLG